MQRVGAAERHAAWDAGVHACRQAGRQVWVGGAVAGRMACACVGGIR